MLIKKEMISFTAPKKCMLHLRLSDAITDNRLREFLDDNVIEERGTCSYEGPRNQTFCYEDHFE